MNTRFLIAIGRSPSHKTQTYDAHACQAAERADAVQIAPDELWLNNNPFVWLSRRKPFRPRLRLWPKGQRAQPKPASGGDAVCVVPSERRPRMIARYLTFGRSWTC